LPPAPRRAAAFAAALGIGAAGGAAFALAGLPLPWMLGAMTAVTAAVLSGMPLSAPAAARPPLVAVIGVMLGAGFHPGLAAGLAGWLPTLAGLLALAAVSGAACWAWLHRIAGLDRTTAYFAGMPGGLVEMIEAGRARGGDEVTITLVHSARIFLVVFTIPFLLEFTEGVRIGARPAGAPPIAAVPPADLGLLVLCALGGAVAGRRLRLPAADLTGPMLVSAVLHGAGLTAFLPAAEILIAAQVGLGAILGCRFRSARPARVARALAVAAGMTAVLLALTFGFALAVARATGLPAATLILAYTPGGLTEMSLVALALGADVAFIAAHHLVRVVLVMVAAPLLFRPDRGGGGRPPRGASGGRGAKTLGSAHPPPGKARAQ
jgi:membrane AbrB-like protein